MVFRVILYQLLCDNLLSSYGAILLKQTDETTSLAERKIARNSGNYDL